MKISRSVSIKNMQLLLFKKQTIHGYCYLRKKYTDISSAFVLAYNWICALGFQNFWY